MKRLVKLLVAVGLVAVIVELLRRRPAPPSASPTAPPTPFRPSTPTPPADVAPSEASPPEPWVTPTAAGGCPAGHPVKAKVSSKIFHVPGGALYERTTADRCYASAEAAEADGFRPSKR